MGKRCKSKHKGIGHNRSLKRGIRDLKHRGKDVDQIYESLIKENNEGYGSGNRSITDQMMDSTPKYDIQGNGMFYCKFCDRYFVDDISLQSHTKQKTHKRRVKSLMTYIPYNG